MSEFIENMSKLTGKTVEILTVEFSDFSEIVNNQFEGRLEGEELVTKSESLFRQKCRSVIKSTETSGAVKINMHVSGVSDTQDKMGWQRSKAIDIYNINPNKAVMEGRVNEFRILDDGIMKRGFDQATQTVIEEMVEKASPNAEKVDDEFWAAPVDSNKKGFGGKPNKSFGQEMPLHKYSCYVYGVAEVEGSDDVRWTKLMLRGNNATGNTFKVNQSYVLEAIDMSDKDSEEYNFIDVDDVVLTETDWNPFEGDFMEEVVSMNFVEHRVMELGDVDEYLKTVEAKKESGKYKDWNPAILVEADVARFFLGKDGVSDRMYVDDDSLRWGDDGDVDGNINVWISGANVIDFGEYSRVLLTCFPSRSRPPKDSPDGTKGRMQLNAYGVFAFTKYKTRYEPEE